MGRSDFVIGTFQVIDKKLKCHLKMSISSMYAIEIFPMKEPKKLTVSLWRPPANLVPLLLDLITSIYFV